MYPIAITLLVLGLDVPESPGRLWGDLTGAWPQFVGYLVSFAFIGSSWFYHAVLSRYLAASDRTFVGLNLILLLCVSFLPFTTGMMATHLTGSDQRLAAVLFGANMTLAAAMMAVIYSYAARNEKLVHAADRAELRHLVKTRWLTTALFGLSTVTAAFVPRISLVFYLAIPALILVKPLGELIRSRPVRKRDREPQ